MAIITIHRKPITFIGKPYFFLLYIYWHNGQPYRICSISPDLVVFYSSWTADSLCFGVVLGTFVVIVEDVARADFADAGTTAAVVVSYSQIDHAETADGEGYCDFDYADMVCIDEALDAFVDDDGVVVDDGTDESAYCDGAYSDAQVSVVEVAGGDSVAAYDDAVELVGDAESEFGVVVDGCYVEKIVEMVAAAAGRQDLYCAAWGGHVCILDLVDRNRLCN